MPWIVLGVVFVLTGVVAALAIGRVVRRHRPAALDAFLPPSVPEPGPLPPVPPPGERDALGDRRGGPEEQADRAARSLAEEAHDWLERQV